MRWDELFDDLEGQWEAAEQAELSAEIADRTRREAARIRLDARLRASCGRTINVRLAGAGQVTGRLLEAGSDWLVLDERPSGVTLVATGAIFAVGALGTEATAPVRGRLAERWTLPFVLRGMARDRTPVRITLVDGSTVTGTIDRVGADFLDLAEHDPDQPRRPGAVRGVLAVAFVALAVVRAA